MFQTSRSSCFVQIKYQIDDLPLPVVMWRSPDKILVRIAKTLFLARQPHLMSEGGCPFIGILSFLSGKEKLAPTDL